VPAVLPPVVADSAPMSEVVKAVPPPPPTLAVLQKKLEETKTKLQLNWEPFNTPPYGRWSCGVPL